MLSASLLCNLLKLPSVLAEEVKMLCSQAEEQGVYKYWTVGCCYSGFLQSWMSSPRPRLKQACHLVLFEISLFLELMPTPPTPTLFFKCSTLLIVDPTGEEEHLSTGTFTIVMDEEGKLCCLHKPGTCFPLQRWNIVVGSRWVSSAVWGVRVFRQVLCIILKIRTCLSSVGLPNKTNLHIWRPQQFRWSVDLKTKTICHDFQFSQNDENAKHWLIFQVGVGWLEPNFRTAWVEQ